ncbi:MAG: shikimate dehydrogenase [Alphaproteobacteria bacterium]
MILSGESKIAGVMGWPVAHSLSPRLHGFWLRQYGIDGAYVPLPVCPETFSSAIRALAGTGFRGVNVTAPHKQAALDACDEVDAVARRIGAVNTVVFTDGRLRGSNSDAFGFLENLREGASTGEQAWQPTAGPAVILGAGGAARAVVVALTDSGVPEVRICNRSDDRAQTLCREIGGPLVQIPWADRGAVLADAAVLVNATSLGMVGQAPLDIDLARLPETAVVTDLVYVPLETPLLAAARARGNRAVDGLGMLLHQARPGFAAWFDVSPEVTPELREFVLAAPDAAGS